MTRKKTTPHERLHARGDACVLALAIACVHVIDGARPVLLVWRDRESGTLGLACGQKNHDARTIDDWAMSHAFHFIGPDPALGILHTLKRGESAVRESAGSPWRRFPPGEGPVSDS